MSANLIPLPCWAFLTAVCATALAQAPVRPDSAGSTVLPRPSHGSIVSIWSGGAYLTLDQFRSPAPEVTAIDKHGTVLCRRRLTIPGASLITILHNRFARGFDGSLAVAGTAYTTDSRGTNFLAWISPDGEQQNVIRTPGFSPFAVTIASDGTIWVAGGELDETGEEIPTHRIVRRYDKDGKLLTALVWRSDLTTDAEVFPARWHPAQASALAASKDRVGFYSIMANTYMEFSLDGETINRVKTPKHAWNNRHVGLGVCDDGQVFATMSGRPPGTRLSSWNILVLDRPQGVWNSVPRDGRWGMVLGCDGTSLATTTTWSAINWLDSKLLAQSR